MADKKLLEESTIRRFMELAKIKPSESGVLSEGMHAGGDRDQAGGVSGKDRLSSVGVRGGVSEKKKLDKKMHQEDLEETVDEEKMEEAYHEEGYDMNEAEDEGGEDMAGDEMGASGEGGDLEAAVQGLVSAMNDVLAAAGMSDKSVELDSGEDEGEDMGGEMSAEDDGAEGAPMMEADQVEEELAESIELVDDTLVEKLLQRVSARLVAEARKSRELAEGKAGGWGKKGMHANAKKAKSDTTGHTQKSKSGTPFTKKKV